MLAQTKLRPGQPGTKKLTAQFAAQLICVQYQCAAQSRRRYQTAEIIIEKASWHPPEKLTAEKEIIGLRIAFRETEMQQQVTQAGGGTRR